MKLRYALSAAAVVVTMAGAAGYGTLGTAAVAKAGATTPGRVASPAINWGKPIFVDNFNGTKLNPIWTVYDSPYAPTPRTPQSVQVKDGMLDLIAHYQSPYGYVGGGVDYGQWRTYGRWVIRFRADAAAGSEPVLLLWPKGKWPNVGEVDILGEFRPSRLGGEIWLIMGSVNHHIGYRIPESVNFTKWHTMAVDWLPDHLTFWLDGKVIWYVKRQAGGHNFVPDTPFHLAMQLDAGCSDGCKPNAKTPKQVLMQIDWVKIYKEPAGY